jgi:hypothetical protein
MFVAPPLVIDLRRRDTDHPPPSQTRSLREIETGRYRRKKLVKTSETLGEITTNQHRRRPDKRNFADDVVLLKIDFPFVKPAVGLTEHIRRAPNRF